MVSQLTKDAIHKLFSSGRREVCVVQVLGMKLLSNQQAGQPPRWRISISDGDYQGAATLATQLNPLIDSGQLKQNTVIKVTEFVINAVGGAAGSNTTPHKLVVILKCEVLSQMDGMIGNPIKYTSPDEHAAAAVAAGAGPSSLGARTLPGTLRGGPAPQTASRPNAPAPAQPRPASNAAPVAASSSGGGVSQYAQQNRMQPLPQPAPQQQLQQRQTPPQQMQQRPQQYQQPQQQQRQSPPPAVPAQQQQQQQQQYRRSTPSIEMNPNELSAIQPVATLNPYNTRWTIKARITRKGDVKEWNNQKGTGKLFHVDLVDSEGGEIRATMFNRAVDRWFPVFEEGHVYIISRGVIKQANKRFSNIPHDYELNLDENSIVQTVDEDSTIPALKFNLVKIAELQNVELDSTIDVVGVVTKVGNVSEVNIKSRGTTMQKQTISLVDDTNVGVELTLWGAGHVARTDIVEGEVVAAKHVRVSSFNGISLSAVQASVITVNPPIPEVDHLHAWYRQQMDQGGGTLQAEMISRPDANRPASSGSGRRFIRKTLAQVKEQRLGFSSVQTTADNPNSGDTFWTKAFLSFVRVPQDSMATGGGPTSASSISMWYPACPNEACKKKKVVDNHNGTWSCEKCNQIYDQAEFRYVMQCQIVDNTGNQWCTAFNDQAVSMLGVSANDLAAQVSETGSVQSINDVVDECLFSQYSFRIRAKAEMVNDEERLKCVIMDARKIDPTKESFTVLSDIREYHNRGLMPGSTPVGISA